MSIDIDEPGLQIRVTELGSLVNMKYRVDIFKNSRLLATAYRYTPFEALVVALVKRGGLWEEG